MKTSQFYQHKRIDKKKLEQERKTQKKCYKYIHMYKLIAEKKRAREKDCNEKKKNPNKWRETQQKYLP